MTQNQGGFVTQAPTVSTTTPAPTPAYEGPYAKNPNLISQDLFIALDTSTPSDKLETFKTFASALVNLLSVTNLTTVDAASRLSVMGLTGAFGFAVQFGPYWSLSTQTAAAYISSISSFPYPNSYFGGLEETYLPNAFPTPGHLAANQPAFEREQTRPNAQRVFLLFSNQGPEENVGETTYTPPINFKDLGVHPILVHIDMADLSYFNHIDDPTTFNGEKWDIFKYDIGDSTENNLLRLVNEHLVTADPYTCQLALDDIKPIANNTVKSFAIPKYYNGVAAPGVDVWPEDNFQHYCNFQSTTVTVKQIVAAEEDPVNICFTAFYELEPNQDFVDVIADGVLIERFTGIDVSGSTFNAKAETVQFVFSSNEKNVYDGFFVKFTTNGCPP